MPGRAWPKVIPVGLDEARAEVGDDTRQGMTGVETRLGCKADESLGGLDLDHERLHDVLSGVIDPEEQAVPGAPDEDHLAVDAEKPTPRRPQLSGHLQRGFRLAAEL